jgi:hypothetical protein
MVGGCTGLKVRGILGWALLVAAPTLERRREEARMNRRFGTVYEDLRAQNRLLDSQIPLSAKKTAGPTPCRLLITGIIFLY